MTTALNLYEMKPDDFKALIARNRENNWPDVTAQERMFAFYYLEDYNHRNAAKRAGYTQGQGIHLLRKPLISEFVAYVQQEYQRRSFIDADFVRAQWLDVLPKLKGEEEIAILHEGETTYAHKFHAAETVRALSELGKATKFYEGGSGNASVQVHINLGALGISDNSAGVVIEGSVDE